MAKPQKQIEARKLRMGGFSVGNIAQKLKVSKGSVSLWCSDIELTEKQKMKLHNEMVRGSYEGRMIGVQMQKDKKIKKIEECSLRAKKDIVKLKKKELMIAGLSLYWGEGAKNCSNVRFYNSNPLVISFIMKWFRESLKIKEDRFLMYINVNEIHAKRLKDIKEYWSKITRIPIGQFRKPTLIKTKNKKVYENFPGHYGTLSVRIAKSKYLLYQILAWIEALGVAE
ncbi:hypothetical protein KJ761_02430 [Patescibacteria group bacterium]|nr:hypothetical protein [Patescibacteria group bacterium]